MPRLTTAPISSPKPNHWLWSTFVVLIALLMASTGWLALREGATRYMLPFQMQDVGAHTAQMAQALRADPTVPHIQQYSNELAALASLTSPQRFVDSRLVEHGVYLSQMPRLNQVLLTSHIFLGVFCMLFGGIQFWPQFRQRFMRVHRLIGGGYVLTAPISVLLSFAYMAVTPPHHLYTHLTSYVALWLVGAVALVSIGMAVRALRQRRIHEHMAYMALSFACLLVAPMLRLNWVALAWLFPSIDQETLNLVTLGVMLPECLLIGYGLILANRPYGRRMSKRPVTDLARSASSLFLRWRPLWYVAAWGLAVINVLHYMLGQGLSSASAASQLVNAALLARDAQVLVHTPALGSVFGLSISMALLLALYLFMHLLKQGPQADVGRVVRASRYLVALSLSAGISATMLGWQIGLAPDRQWLSGGTFYTVPGVLTVVFALVFAGALARRHQAMMKESLAFLLGLLPFSGLFYVYLWVLQWLPIPADYIQHGQAFILSAGASTTLLFVSMFYVVHGQATREHG